MTKTLYILAVRTEIVTELHAIYATDREDAERQANEKEHPGKRISLQECPTGFTIYRLVLPGHVEVSDEVPYSANVHPA